MDSDQIWVDMYYLEYWQQSCVVYLANSELYWMIKGSDGFKGSSLKGLNGQTLGNNIWKCIVNVKYNLFLLSVAVLWVGCEEISG